MAANVSDEMEKVFIEPFRLADLYVLYLFHLYMDTSFILEILE